MDKNRLILSSVKKSEKDATRVIVNENIAFMNEFRVSCGEEGEKKMTLYYFLTRPRIIS